MGTAAQLPAQPVPGYRWRGGLVADNFAGGGGASTGISQAIDKSPDIAVNHNAEALMMHEENHPDTIHYNESVWDVNIPEATAGIPVLFGWFSPDCTHFSVAKGGAPVKKEIRGLAWIIKKWAGQGDMAVFFMENVPEFVTWGPLIAKRCKHTGRVVTLDLIPDPMDPKGKKMLNRVAEPGEVVPYRNQALVPDKKRAGKTFRQFCKQLGEMGYQFEFNTLVASEYGAATIRKRFFGIGRKDGLPIIWPAKTHAPRKLALATGLQPEETAGDHLDWSIPCPSIFEEGRKPLAENTLRRIAKGIEKFVINAGDDAFLVKVNHGYDQFRGQSLDEPLQTITGKLGTGVVAASMIPVGYGERPGQDPRTHSLQEPLPTIVGSNKHAVVEAQLEPITVAAGMKFRGDSAGFSCNDPLPTITAGAGAARPAGAPHALGAMQVDLAPITAEFITTVDHASTRNPATGMGEPLSTVTGKARHLRVAALLKHYTGVTGQMLDKPLPTITAKDHNSVMEAQLEPLDPVHDLEEAITAAHIQRDFGKSVGSAAGQPLGAITAGGSGKAALVASSLIKLKGSCKHGQSLDEPLGTIQAQGNHYGEVRAFLIKYYTTGAIGQDLNEPLHTITSKARLGLVTIHGQDYQIVDIGMRMLKPHELYRCQGFPEGYEHQVVMGKKLPDHAQVRMVGNSVPPQLAKALVEANIPKWALEREEALRA